MRKPPMLRPPAGRNLATPRGFTLVELLVVIGIISVLMALVLAALARARRFANAVSCESNLRQWGAATLMYANENKGFLPRRGQGVQATSQVTRPADWFNALPPLLGSKTYAELVTQGSVPRPGNSSVWICPEAVDLGGTYYWSYGMNMALSVWDANQNQGQPDKITGVGITSIMVLFADAPGNYCAIYPSSVAGGYNPVTRHNNYVNLCFLDGHVATFPGSYIGCGTGVKEQPDVQWLPPSSTWGGAQ
jgi:prepilin-type N-terminal cleavage/methylation domain-containing protein/prepilin-type processing-associated H-X9-DG protein